MNLKDLGILRLFILCVLLCFSFSSLRASGKQDNTYIITGIVKSDEGEPLVGVSVFIRGSSSGTVTDLDGNYSLKVKETERTEGTIVASYLGYRNFEESISGRQRINIVLQPSLETQLNEVQVVAYGTQKKITLTGAVSSIGSEELTRVPTASIGNMLTGVLTGVSSIQSSGQPGGDDPDLFIRGLSTLRTHDAKPLILVDGVERSFTQIDPNEIESVTILKDASSTAVFGIRGANGVILVTTKRGKTGKMSINASVQYGIQKPVQMPVFANSYQYALYHNEANENDGKTGIFNQAALEGFRTGSDPILYPDTDWMKMLFKSSAPQMQANVNISGGTEKVRYFISIGSFNQEGFFKNYDKRVDANYNYDRYNYRSNLDIDFTKHTQVAINLGGRVEQRNSPRTLEDQNQLFRFLHGATPFSGAGIVDGKWVTANTKYVGLTPSDPLSQFLGRGYDNRTTNALDFDMSLTQKLDVITKGLEFKIKGAYNSWFDHTKSRGTSMPAYVPYLKKDLTWLEGTFPEEEMNDLVYVQDNEEGIVGYGENRNSGRNWYAEASLNWERSFEEKHNFTALALYNQSKNYYPDSKYPEISRGYVGLVSRVTYNYDTRYLAEVNIGYNGSENFKKDRRYGFFPAFSGGWVLSNEEFIGNTEQNFFLKLRASYGKVGNDRYHPYNNDYMERFLYLEDSYTIGGGYNFGTAQSWTNGSREGLKGNPFVTWETAYKQNYGIDFGFIDQKLTGSVDGFYEKRKGLFAQENSLPAYHAMELPVLNIGKTQNKGMEVSVKWNEKIDQFRYWANLNVSYAKNKIVYKDEIPSPYAYTMETGKPIGQPFGYKVRGYYYEGMENVAEHNYELKPGDVVYEDLNGDGRIDGNDRTAIGYPNYPLLNGGITLGFEWKGFDFSVLFTGATMTSRVMTEAFRVPVGTNYYGSLLKYHYDHRWTSTESVNSETLPRASFDGLGNNTQDSELWIKDASYIRLKNIELGYNFNASFMRTLGMQTCRVYMTGYNWLTFTKLKYTDPESLSSGQPQYPVMKVFNFGLNVVF